MVSESWPLFIGLSCWVELATWICFSKDNSRMFGAAIEVNESTEGIFIYE